MDVELLAIYIKLRSLDRPVGVREFMRIMGYNSPGKAKYVLDRLVRYGLASRNEDGKYIASKELPLELSAYMVIKGYFLPKTTIYAVALTVFVVAYSILASKSLIDIIAFVILLIPYYLEIVLSLSKLKSLKSRITK